MPEMLTGATAAKRVRTGVVIRKGPGFVHPSSGKKIEVSDLIQPGARVVMGEYAGTDYEHEEAHGREVYTVMQEAEVLCLLGDMTTAVDIPAACADQKTLDKANEKAAYKKRKESERMQEEMQSRGKEIANEMMGRSPGGLHIQ